MKIVYDNIIFSLQRAGGVSAMWANLIERMQKDADCDCYFLEYPGADKNIFRQAIVLPEDRIVRLSARGGINVERFLSVDMRGRDNCIFHSSYYRMPRNGQCKVVTTLHDFTYERMRVTGRLRTMLHSYQKKRAINKADMIVSVSGSTERDLLLYYPGISDLRKKVIYNAPVCDATYMAEVAIKDYLLFVGSREPYKGFDLALEVARATGLRLVVCGAPLSDSERKMVAGREWSDKIVEIVYPSNVELAGLYASAKCLLYPSAYEGFGIPIVEAQAYGCPVVAVDGSSINEVIGEDYPLLAGDRSVDVLVEKVKMLDSPSVLEDVKKKGLANSLRFSWDEIVKEYKQVYQSLHDSSE